MQDFVKSQQILHHRQWAIKVNIIKRLGDFMLGQCISTLVHLPEDVMDCCYVEFLQ